MNARDTCMKCGCKLRAKTEVIPYCETCKVRLGFPSDSLIVVTPNAATHYQKQLDEPVLETWLIRKLEDLDDREHHHNRELERRRKHWAAIGLTIGTDNYTPGRNGHARTNGKPK